MRKIIFSLGCVLIAFQGLSQKDNHSKYSIKYSPTQLAFGELHFAYEQRILPQSSIEIGFGPTISEIGIIPFILDDVVPSPTFMSGETRENGLGFFGSLAFRYYPISGLATAPRGLYIGPEIKYRLYTTNYVDYYNDLGERTGAATQISFKFFTGYQFWLGNKFSIDLFTAVGVGTTRVERHYAATIYNEVIGDYTNTWMSASRNKVLFTGAFGFKFGLGGVRKDK